MSFGLLRPGDARAYYSMYGLSYNLSPTVKVVSDDVGGKGNYTTLGIITALSKAVSLKLAYALPNAARNEEGGYPRGFVVNVVMSFI